MCGMSSPSCQGGKRADGKGSRPERPLVSSGFQHSGSSCRAKSTLTRRGCQRSPNHAPAKSKRFFPAHDGLQRLGDVDRKTVPRKAPFGLRVGAVARGSAGREGRKNGLRELARSSAELG